MNFIVSVFICVGYIVDYSIEVVCFFLLLEKYITFEFEQSVITIGHLVLNLCIFVAYSILMKIFRGYQNQVNEAAAKVEA